MRRATAWAICSLFCALSVPLHASNIDVTGRTWLTVKGGETLAFEFSDSNFVWNARGLGVSEVPSAITFQFLTAANGAQAEFQATLEAADGSASLALAGPLGFVPGTLSSSQYNGPVSALAGTFYLSAADAQRIFAGSSAVLVLRNLGPEVDFGLAPFTLRQDLYLSVRGDGFSVGAAAESVVFDPPDAAIMPTPEPSAGLLAGLGGVAIGLGGALSNRLRQQRIKCYEARIQMFAIRLATLIGFRWQIGILSLKCRKSNQRSIIIN